MASVVQVVSVTLNNGTSLTATIAPATAGNRLVAIMSNNRGNTNAVPPAGFTEVQRDANTSGCNITIAAKDAAGGETDITVQAALGNSRICLTVYELADVDVATAVVPNQVTGGASLTVGPATFDGIAIAAVALGTSTGGGTLGDWSDSFVTDAKSVTSAGTNNVGLATGHLIGSGTVQSTETWTDPVDATGFLLAFPSTGGGTPPASGSATGSLTLSGSATGSAPAVPQASGSVTGALVLAGSATGAAPAIGAASGSASGSLGLSGSTTGSTDHSGSMTGALALAGSATGATAHEGHATGALTLDGQATGATQHEGQTDGSVSISGSATGSSPSVGGASGSTSGTLSLSGSSTGSTQHGGHASGALNLSGSAEGSTPHSGTAAGTIVLTGLLVGSTRHDGHTTGALTLAGSAAGNAPGLVDRDIVLTEVTPPSSGWQTSSPDHETRPASAPAPTVSAASSPSSDWTDTEPAATSTVAAQAPATTTTAAEPGLDWPTTPPTH